MADGRAVFVRRGCYGCHKLAGIRETGKIGPSLAGVADRDPDQLPYGGKAVRRTADNYIFLKLQQPDALGSPSLMPTFSFTPAQAATIMVPLASLHKTDLPASRVVREAPPAGYRPRGPFGELVTRYRCLSCHRIGGSGGDLSTVPLDRIGSQLQHDYLVAYLQNPGAVRVSVEARMPVFHMLPEEARTIADYAATTLPRRRPRPVRRALHAGRGAPRRGALPAARLRRLPPAQPAGRVRGTGSVEHGRAAAAGLDRGLAGGAQQLQARHAAARLRARRPRTRERSRRTCPRWARGRAPAAARADAGSARR